MTVRTLCGILLVLAGGAAPAAEPPAPVGIPDLVGPRALALSSGTGIAASNEGIYLNPAAAGARKRYSMEALLLVDRRGADTSAQLFGGSVVDSLSGPVTGGFSYVRAQRGEFTGSVWHVMVGGPIAQDFHLGVSGKYLSVKGPRNASAATVDAGLFWQVADVLSLGVAGYDLVPIANEVVAPLGVGAGIGIGNDRFIQLTADWRADFDRAGKTTNRYGAGVEVLLGQLVPLRGGWSRDETLGTRWWSLGAGLVTETGVALDVGYRQSLDDPSARTVAATLKLFLFQ
ncbi:MAG TPA: hypothetical protein VIV57_11335 [Anaeromyxobacter sp.]